MLFLDHDPLVIFVSGKDALYMLMSATVCVALYADIPGNG